MKKGRRTWRRRSEPWGVALLALQERQARALVHDDLLARRHVGLAARLRLLLAEEVDLDLRPALQFHFPRVQRPSLSIHFRRQGQSAPRNRPHATPFGRQSPAEPTRGTA